MADINSKMGQARGLADTVRWFFAEMPAKNCFKNFDFNVVEASLVIEMKSPTDYRADMTLKLTTAKKKLGSVWFRMPEGQILDVKQDRTRAVKHTKTPEYLGVNLAVPISSTTFTTLLIRYRFSPSPLGMIPLPIAPSMKFPLTVIGKCGQGYDLIFPGALQGVEMDRGLKQYTWIAPRTFQLHLLAMNDPKRHYLQLGDYNFYYYYHPACEASAKAVVETLAEAYVAQVKMNGALAYKDYYIVDVSPKLCPNPVGLGGIIAVPAGIFKTFDKARASGIIENELLKEWKGRKGEMVQQSR